MNTGYKEDGRSAAIIRGIRLEYFTLGWTILEASVGLIAGISAGSVALVGFALDSIVETSSGSILIWRLKAERRGANIESVERRAVRFVAAAFFALGLYVGGKAIFTLLSATRPDHSTAGIVLALVSLVVMPLLAWRKRLWAKRLDSRALQADSAQTTLCTYLSAILLIGLLANSLLGWWWADPLAGLGIAGLAAKEGHELWTTEEFCCS